MDYSLLNFNFFDEIQYIIDNNINSLYNNTYKNILNIDTKFMLKNINYFILSDYYQPLNIE